MKRSIYVVKYKTWSDREYFPSQEEISNVVAQTPLRALEITEDSLGERIHVQDISFYGDVSFWEKGE